MQTTVVYAAMVENNDHIVIEGEVLGYVYMMTDHGDMLEFDVVDDDGDHYYVPFAPFDNVTIVESFD